MATIPMQLIIWLISSGLLLAPVQGNQGVVVITNTASITYPQYVQFQLNASNPEHIQKVTLIYGTNQLSCQSATSRHRFEFEQASQVDLEWKLEFSHSGVIPPGVELWWQWEITDSSGNLTQTEKKSIIIQDERFHWQTASQNGITVQWYQGSQSFGQAILQDAIKDLNRISTQMDIQPSGKIWITDYASTEEMRNALVTINNWAGAVAIPDSGSVLMGLAPDELNQVDYYLSHELTHLVVGQLTFNCMGVELPTWLNEGLAESAVGKPSQEEKDAVIQAIESQKLPALNDIADGFSPYQDQAVLEYVQSNLVIEYLLQTYGSQKISALLAAFQSGLTTDDALKKVYDMDTAGVDAAWRKSLGFSVAIPTQQATQPARTQVATLSLWTSVVRPTMTATQTPSPTATGTATPVVSMASPSPPGASEATPTAPISSNRSPIPFCGGALILPVALILFLFRNKENGS